MSDPAQFQLQQYSEATTVNFLPRIACAGKNLPCRVPSCVLTHVQKQRIIDSLRLEITSKFIKTNL